MNAAAVVVVDDDDGDDDGVEDETFCTLDTRGQRLDNYYKSTCIISMLRATKVLDFSTTTLIQLRVPTGRTPCCSG